MLDSIDLIRHALTLAESCHSSTSPNPKVGCLITRDGHIIGKGCTQPAGQAHAEVMALSDVQLHGLDARGATVYVTLEPCNHHGRTPPCVDALIRAGVAKVVIAIEDPNPLVAGQGIERLRASGIEVECGVMADEAREMNIGFFSRMQRGRPWVRMKSAASLDGKTALFNGQSQWITSQAAREDGHFWRARACAIMTGIGTVKQDNPRLSVRAVETPRQPRRIVLDSKLEIDPTSRVLSGGGTLVVTATHDLAKENLLRDVGADILYLPTDDNKVDLHALMLELARRGINELHVEAGAKLNGAMVRNGCVDELLLYLAPMLLGDAQSMVALDPIDSLDRKIALKFHEVKQIGTDLRVLARFT